MRYLTGSHRYLLHACRYARNLHFVPNWDSSQHLTFDPRPRFLGSQGLTDAWLRYRKAKARFVIENYFFYPVYAWLVISRSQRHISHVVAPHEDRASGRSQDVAYMSEIFREVLRRRGGPRMTEVEV